MAETLARAAHSELLIRKSRFLGCVQPVSGRSEALQAVQALRQQHPRATHVCWALLAGGESAAVDDGEPGGTAGLPMLAVLRKQQLQGVLATVVRYFGGVKLGAGGLVRAYTDAVARALDDAERVPLRHWLALRCTLPYSLEGQLAHALATEPVRRVHWEYAAEVTLSLQTPEEEAGALRSRLDELAHGQLQWADNAP